MRAAGLVVAIVVAVLAARAEAEPVAAEPASVASVHDGMMLGGGIGLGLEGEVDFRVGWMLNPRVAVFATGLWSESISDKASHRLLGVGARLWISDRAFLEGRLGQGVIRDPMSGSEMTVETKGAGGLAGLGVEIVRSRHFGLEFHLEGTYTAGDGGVTGGVGVTFY